MIMTRAGCTIGRSKRGDLAHGRDVGEEVTFWVGFVGKEDLERRSFFAVSLLYFTVFGLAGLSDPPMIGPLYHNSRSSPFILLSPFAQGYDRQQMHHRVRGHSGGEADVRVASSPPVAHSFPPRFVFPGQSTNHEVNSGPFVVCRIDNSYCLRNIYSQPKTTP